MRAHPPSDYSILSRRLSLHVCQRTRTEHGGDLAQPVPFYVSCNSLRSINLPLLLSPGRLRVISRTYYNPRVDAFGGHMPPVTFLVRQHLIDQSLSKLLRFDPETIAMDDDPHHHHNDHNEHERRFHGGPDRLRAPDRLARMEVPRVAALSTADITVASALDIGTGTGVFAEAFAALGLAVTGVDVNAELLTVAHEYVPAAEFKQAPAEQLPFADRSFDLVFLGHVLHEADNPLVALKEARRVARQRVAILEWPYRQEEKGPPLEHRLKPDFVADLARQAGFQSSETIHLEHMDFYRLTP